LADLFACHDVAWTFEKNGQNLEWLIVELNLEPLLAQFACAQIDLKYAKADAAGKHACSHRRPRCLEL
jgi:hypothetical protein